MNVYGSFFIIDRQRFESMFRSIINKCRENYEINVHVLPLKRLRTSCERIFQSINFAKRLRIRLIMGDVRIACTEISLHQFLLGRSHNCSISLCSTLLLIFCRISWCLVVVFNIIFNSKSMYINFWKSFTRLFGTCSPLNFITRWKWNSKPSITSKS